MTLELDQIPKVIEEMGGAQKISEGLKEYTRRVLVFEAKRPQLLEQYPDKWVAIDNEENIYVADSLGSVIERMNRDEIPRDAIFHLMDTKNQTMILLQQPITMPGT